MRRRFALFAVCILSLMPLALPAGAASAFASPAFETQWKQGEALAPNFWGPLANATDGITEQYLYSGTNKTRLVQYFDKGRMELFGGVTNTPDVKVTNGLLATEMVKGQIQIADDQFQPKDPPAIPIAGDPDNTVPTYAQLGGSAASLLAPATARPGVGTVPAISGNGTVIADGIAVNGRAVIGGFDDTTKHNVPGVFVDYRNKAGLGTIGYAISEPFGAVVKVGGQSKQVLIQVFERRVLTYTASNDPAFQVEMGNIGQHYYKWRYANSTPAPASGNTPVAGTTAPPAANQPDPYGPAAPLTRTYTDTQGRFAFKYPDGWHVDATLGMRHAVGLTGPFTSIEMTVDIVGQAPMLSDEIDAFKAGWTGQDIGAVFSQEATRDGQIGGEPAKFYSALLSFTRNGQPVSLNILFATAFHGGDAYAFFASSSGTQLARAGDINAMIGSFTFLK